MAEDDFFDFGFTAVDENELDIVQKEQKKVAEVGSEAARAAETARTTKQKLDKLYNAITPLLNNLKNESRERIYTLAW